MITEATIQRIWSCQREIKVGEKLLAEIKELADKSSFDEAARRITDAFGRERDFQLGVPSSHDYSHRLFNVSPTLAVHIITAHIANKKAELIEANECAKIELGMNEGLGTTGKDGELNARV
jgi:hypothetical protein